jgi:TetR/AcrR family transcriptional repressor of nem operon
MLEGGRNNIMNAHIHDYPEKKLKLLNTALGLMLAKGYHATTVDDICAEADVTKGSFFHYFKSKEEAAKATLVYFGMMQQGMIQGSEIEKETDPWTRLKNFLDFYLLVSRNPDLPNSCLASTFAQELSEEYPEIRALCEENFATNAKPLHDILLECKQSYAPQGNIDAQSMAEYFISVYQGSLILAKAKQDPSIIEENVEHFRTYAGVLFNKQ